MNLGLKAAVREKRRAVRQRTRLRPGRLFDTANRFLVDCAFHDISATGARVRLMDDREIPATLLILDVRELATKRARVAWRKERDLGLQYF
ncbi:hypothetical protein BH10PSE9_BH10PSE9_01780 [soil metagenome]